MELSSRRAAPLSLILTCSHQNRLGGSTSLVPPACEQALHFEWRAKRASRERASEQRSREGQRTLNPFFLRLLCDFSRFPQKESLLAGYCTACKVTQPVQGKELGALGAAGIDWCIRSGWYFGIYDWLRLFFCFIYSIRFQISQKCTEILWRREVIVLCPFTRSLLFFADVKFIRIQSRSLRI